MDTSTDADPINKLMEDLKAKIIQVLKLEDIQPGDIDSEAPLFGEGLGLDSIDALELVVMMEKEYGVVVTEMETAKKAFASVRALASFIMEKRT